MAKVIDITEKLNFEENPKMRIKSTECEVNTDAPTVLKLMQLIGNGDNITPNLAVDMYNLIFNESERKKIDKLKLKFTDFQTMVMAAMSLITGDAEPGE